MKENLCKGYLVFSEGFMKPLFYLDALFLAHGSLDNDPIIPRKKEMLGKFSKFWFVSCQFF